MSDLRTRLRQTIEERATAHEAIVALHRDAGDTPLSAEQTQEWERLDARLVTLGGQDGRGGEISRLERALALEEEENDPAYERRQRLLGGDQEREGRAGDGDDPTVYASYAEYLADQRDLPQDRAEYRQAFYRFLQSGGGRVGSALSDAEERALATATGPEGGYTVPTTTAAMLVERQTHVSALRDLAWVIATETGEELKFPLEAAIGAAVIRLENVAGADSDIVFGLATLRAHRFQTTVFAPRELLQDAIVDLEAYIARVFARRMAKLQGPKFLAGTGNNEPRGVIGDLQVGLTKGVAANPTVTADDAIDLMYSLLPEYRGESAWMGSTAVFKALRKQKDANGQYIWERSTQVGQPDLLLGHPVREDQYMPDLAPAAKPLAFGSWGDAVMIRDVAGIHFQRLVELRAREGQVGFLMEQRSDCAVVNPEAAKTLQTGAAV